ncbi:hypothetical protein HPB52_006137 [Rhipicephalus sanguineus]|uniref:Uncharacterized protein n=1 Tax=Rhipicephalus sanguineus TaxID=34632 RepID=A0A9D4SW21_RHISA|nr:hypothetical protein HPB52_006137 [Rhipicephalus sanguineus]
MNFVQELIRPVIREELQNLSVPSPPTIFSSSSVVRDDVQHALMTSPACRMRKICGNLSHAIPLHIAASAMLHTVQATPYYNDHRSSPRKLDLGMSTGSAHVERLDDGEGIHRDLDSASGLLESKSMFRPGARIPSSLHLPPRFQCGSFSFIAAPIRVACSVDHPMPAGKPSHRELPGRGRVYWTDSRSSIDIYENS